MVRLLLLFLIAALLLLLSLYWHRNNYSQEPAKIVSQVEEKLAAALANLNSEVQIISESISRNEDWPIVKNAFFLSDSVGIIQWNSNQYFPEPTFFSSDTLLYQRSGTGHYVVVQRSFSDNRYLTGFLLLQNGYSIQNQYLFTSVNQNIFPESGVTLNLSGNVFPIQYLGRDLLAVSINQTALEKEIDWKSWGALVLGVLSLVIFLWQLIGYLAALRKRWLAPFAIFFILLAIRLLMVHGQFPGTSATYPIFNPEFFASSSFNDSIGNFLLNTMALLAVAWLTFVLTKNTTLVSWRAKERGIKVLTVSVLLLLCFGSQLLPFLYLETIYHNSAIIPDISEQLYFDEVRWCAVGCILLSCFAGVYFFFTFFRLALRIGQSSAFVYLTGLAIASVLFFGYHLMTDRHYEVPALLTIINLVALFYSSASRRLKYIFTSTTSLILFELVVFSSQSALAIRMLSEEREHEAMIKFGSTFLVERDILGEYLLNQAIIKIDNDAFIRQQLVNPFSRLNSIKQKIKHNHLSAYFDRYDTRIYLFDNRGQPVADEPDMDLKTLINDFVPLTQNTAYKGIYFVRNPTNQLVKRYLAVIPVRYHVAGFIVLDLTLRQVLPVTVFPKLLLDNRFSDYAYNPNRSFAVFDKGTMINSSGEFNYQKSLMAKELANPVLYRAGIVRDGFRHVAVEDLNGQVAIISTKTYSGFSLLTNFSFYFLLGLAGTLLGFFVLNFRVWKFQALTYSNRIQLYVYLAVVLPLLALALTTLRVSSVAEEKRFREMNESKAGHLTKSLASIFPTVGNDLQNELVRQAMSAGVDVTVFSVRGELLASSQPDIFLNQLVSRFVHPEALSKIKRGNYLFTLNDKIGELEFRNTYGAVRSPITGEVLAIISVPFFESQESSENDQIRLISNILTVLVFVLLLFYLLSFIALNWLTKPLHAIAASLKRTTLSGSNRKLIWQSRDEIGEMVKEYNQMIDNLWKSREELEKRQRETAWREMARQVAHEIKNPLTPIKLTLQQLEKSIQDGKAIPEKTSQSIKTVLRQVDILNDIASSFSAFAQMPELKLERTNVVDLLDESIALFTDAREGRVVFKRPTNPIWVSADRKLFSRIFSNIILNAFQSNKPGETVLVKIEVIPVDNNCQLSFSDNGVGIEPDVIEKIFIPYFSTKETGTGLGLAIAKQGIEQAGGKIWCQSQYGSGTVFLISLPLLP